MKINFASRILFLLVALVIVAGCATNGTDWNARVGHFTYDQAVLELGPPDKTAKLTDGQTVAEWVTRYSTPGSTSLVGGGYYGTPGAPGGVARIQNPPTYRESKLALTFSPENILTAWTRR